MFVLFLAQLTVALIERTVRHKMMEQKIKALPILPEGRDSKTPTVEQLFNQFSSCQLISITHEKQLIKTIRQPLSNLQTQLLELMEVAPKLFE